MLKFRNLNIEKFKAWGLIALTSFMVLILISMIAVGVFVFSAFGKNAEPKELIIAKNKQFKESVAAAHTLLNEAVGFGRIEHFKIVSSPEGGDNSDVIYQAWEPTATKIEELITPLYAQTNDPLIKEDLQNVLYLISYMRERDVDRDLLVYLHRILHDLDYYAFNTDGKKRSDYWGITNVLEGDSEVNGLFKNYEPLKDDM